MGKVYDDMEVIGVVRNIAAATRNANAYAALTGATVTVPAGGADPTQADSLEYIRVDMNMTLEKATAGTVTVGVAIDGVVDADTERTVSFAQAPAGSPLGVGGTFYLPRTSATAKVITLQGKTSEANVGTFSKITMSVARVRTPGGLG